MLTRVLLASSTHLDLHDERMARSALESGAKQIRKKYVPLLIEHDFDRQIGILLNAKVAKLPDGEYGLFAVAGEFENASEKIAYKNGERNTVHERYEEELEGIVERVSLASVESLEATSSPRNLNIAELLAIHLDSTKVLDTGEVYKIKRYIASAGDLEIHVYPKDHPNENPGHFHIISKQRNIDTRFNIETLKHQSNKKGSLTNNDLKKIINFFETHPAALKLLREEHHRINA
jgi:hypothetical protein